MSDPREYPQAGGRQWRPGPVPGPAAARSALFPASSPPADPPRSDPRIEDYLDQIYAPLVGWVPYAARTELRAELQAHLESLVAAYEELGNSPDTAVHEALAQSGDPKVVAHEWMREWERVLPRRKAPPAWYSTLVALGCFAVAARLFFGLIVAAQAGAPVPMWLGYAVSVLLPLLAGLTTGVLSRARPVQAVLAALVLLFPLFPPMAMALANSTGTDWDFNQVAGMALVQGIIWLPIGCASAAFGGWLRTRREQAPKRWLLPA